MAFLAQATAIIEGYPTPEPLRPWDAATFILDVEVLLPISTTPGISYALSRPTLAPALSALAQSLSIGGHWGANINHRPTRLIGLELAWPLLNTFACVPSGPRSPAQLTSLGALEWQPLHGWFQPCLEAA
jgi:hypothetical protein